MQRFQVKSSLDNKDNFMLFMQSCWWYNSNACCEQVNRRLGKTAIISHLSQTILGIHNFKEEMDCEKSIVADIKREGNQSLVKMCSKRFFMCTVNALSVSSQDSNPFNF